MNCIISHIARNLYLGDLDDVNNHPLLEQFQIKKVISLVDDTMNVKQKDDVEYFTFEIEDDESANISSLFDKCNEIMKQCECDDVNLLIHCRDGMSRSPSVMIAYLMNKERWDFITAYSYVKDRRWIIQPNNSFARRLQEYGDNL